MNIQLEIFFSQNVHRDDPVTSYESAERVHEFASGHHEIIFQVLLKHSGLTSEEVSFHCDLNRWQCARRLPEMAKKGLVIQTSETRDSKAGRPCVVWRVV